MDRIAAVVSHEGFLLVFTEHGVVYRLDFDRYGNPPARVGLLSKIAELDLKRP